MNIDLDTFLTTVYCTVDDLYRERFASAKPQRRGVKPQMSDSEVLSLALVSQWQGDRSETAFIRFAASHWRRLFPRLLSQSAYNRRGRDLSGVLCQLGLAIASITTTLAQSGFFEVIDTLPVPLMRRCRGKHSSLFGNEAGIGRGGSDRDWYYGVKLLAVVNDAGTITGFTFGPANTEERWLAEALLRWRYYPQAPAPNAEELAEILGPAHRRHGQRIGPTGPIVCDLSAGKATPAPLLGDLGFRGENWVHHWRMDYQAYLLTKQDYASLPTEDRRKAEQRFTSLRQVVETVFGWLDQVFGIKFPRARSPWGLRTRIAAKLAAFNIGIMINHLFNRPTFAFFNPLTA